MPALRNIEKKAGYAWGLHSIPIEWAYCLHLPNGLELFQ